VLDALFGRHDGVDVVAVQDVQLTAVKETSIYSHISLEQKIMSSNPVMVSVVGKL
jgi:hypothetical protein